MLGKMEIRSPPGSKPRDGRHCDLCGCSQPAVRCDKCGCQIFCLSCDDMYHRHPKRRFHLRKAVDPMHAVPQARPVLPVKVSHLNATNPGDPSKMPLPPPRKKKSSIFGSFRKPSPSSEQNSPPLPKKEYSWTDRLGSIKKFMSNRPLPPLPTSDDNDGEMQPTTNGQSARGNLSFIHRRNDERPPQLPQRSPKSPEFPGSNVEKENRIPNSPDSIPGQIRNGSLELNTNHVNQNQGFPNNEENHWNNRMHNQNGHQAFGTLSRQNHQRMPPGIPGYPGTMHQSSSATDLHSMHNADGMPGAGPVPPHYPHYPMNPHMPPHYPYPMYHPQFPNYPQYFGNSFANLSHPPTSEGDVSDSESSSKHSSRKHQFRKRAKRSQSVMVDRMAYPGQYFPFGPYPGFGPWGAPMPMEAPPSPASSVRSLTRTGRSRRRKKTTSEDEDEELSVSSSPMSRPKSSSSDPKEPRAPLATQTTSSEDESDVNFANRRNKSTTIKRQSEPASAPSPVKDTSNNVKMKQNTSKQSDSDARGTPEIRSEKRPSVDSPTESHQPIQQKPTTHSASPDSWECKHCTFMNPIGNRICQVCCKTATPRTETPVSGHSRPSSAAAVGSRKGSVGSEKASPSPDKAPEAEKKERQDMASLNSALDEAEKQISRGLEELMKLKDDIDSNIPKEKPKSSENQPQPEESPKPVYKSSGRMRTSILDKLNLNKPQASTSTSTETQTGQGSGNRSSERFIEARRYSNSSTTSETFNSPLAQSPDLEGGNFLVNKQKRDSSCQTQQDTIAEYLEKRKAAEEAFLGRPINNFGFGYADRMDMVTSPAPAMFDRFYGGGYGMMQRSHSRASLFSSRVNDFGPMEYGGPGFGYGPGPMYRSVSRGSLTGDYPDGRMSDFHNLRKPDFYLSMEELVERRRQDNIRAQGLELVRMIREAEQQGFNADDIQVALTHCGKQNPLEWLQENWRNMVDSVLTLSTNYGNDKKENDIGLLSENEARDALRLHKGNIWAAVTECVEGRQRKYLELSARGNFSRQDIVDALTGSDGDVEMAYAKLTKSTGKPFLMRIWGAGEGVQNQDGAQPIPEDFQYGPRMYLKDETLNSDEMSEELWSEDGEWDEEDVYEEERGDFEDLQTCHEDLQTCHEDLQTCHEDLQSSPQEMMTPESDRSDYCDAFTIDDRNASSPSDDIFFVIPEAKPEKRRGFLSKLAALRRDSKEQASAVSSTTKEDTTSEKEGQVKEDTISQKSSSSSEQTKSSGALSTLKNTLSAIKDTVTGGSKSEKKVPCIQPEKRTIIVKGQIDHESLSDSFKDNVQLNSVKPLSEDIALNQISKESDKMSDDSLNEEDIGAGQVSTSPKVDSRDNHHLLSDKSSSNYPPSQVESKSKTENRKPQSLAERLKFAKQNRSSANLSSTTEIQNENFIPDAKVKSSANVENQKEKANSDQVKMAVTDVKREDEIKSATVTPNQYSKDTRGTVEMYKIEGALPDVDNSSIEPKSKNSVTKKQSDVNTTTFSTETSSSLQLQEITNEINAMGNVPSSKAETSSTRKLDSNDLKPVSPTEQEASLKNKTAANDDQPQSISPTTKPLIKKENVTVNNNSLSKSIKETDKINSTRSSDAMMKEGEHKSDVSKLTSTFTANNIISEGTKSSTKEEDKRNVMVNKKQTPSSSVPATLSKEDLKEADLKGAASKTTNETDKVVHERNNAHAEEMGHKIDNSQTLNESPELPMTLEDVKSNQTEASTSQKSVSPSHLTKENKELHTPSPENQAINRNQEIAGNVAAIENVPAEGVSSSKEAHRTNTPENFSKNQSETVIETKPNEVEVLTQSVIESNTVNEDNILERMNSSHASSEAEKTSEINSSKSNQQTESLPATSSTQAITENNIEQSITENSETIVAINNNVLEAKAFPPEETSELCLSEPVNNVDQISNATGTERVTVYQEVPCSSEISAHDNKMGEINYVDSNFDQRIKPSENSTEIDLSGNAILAPIESKTSPSTSVAETTKSGKIKTTKVGKIKKSLEKDKKESKDKEKAENLTTLPSSENNLTNVPAQESNKPVQSNETNSNMEGSSSNEVNNTHIENEILVLRTSNEKETINAEKIEGSASPKESKSSTLELNTTIIEETKILASNEPNNSLILENASEMSSEATQNAGSSTEVQSNISFSDTIILTTSKIDQKETGGVSEDSKTEQTVENSKEIPQTPPEVDNNALSVNRELQNSDVSNVLEENKNSIIANIATSPSDNTFSDSVKTDSTNEDNFKKMAPVASATFPEKSKQMATSSTIIVPDNSSPLESTSSTTVPDNSKTVAATSNSTVTDNSKTMTITPSTTLPDNSKTMAATSTTLADNSKTMAVTSSSTAFDNSKLMATSANTVSPLTGVSSTASNDKNSFVPISSKTESSTSAASPDSSNKTTPSSSGISKTVADVKTPSNVNEDTKMSLQKQAEQHSIVPVNDTKDASLSNTLSSPSSSVSKPESASLKRTVSIDDSRTQAVDSDDADSDDSRPSSVTPPSPVDALRSRFEGLAGGTVRGGPIRPASPFRRMSFNSRKQVIALEKKRDTSADKPWFYKKTVTEPVKLPQPKRSIKQQLEMERKVRKMVSDRKCRTYRKAEIVVQLMDMNFEEEEAIQAAHECSTLEQAISYLQQECLLCTGNFPVSQIVSMTHCEHRACRECIRAYFTVQIRDRTILDLLCPFCNEPDIGDEDIAQDYFNHLDIMLKKLVDFEIHELFQRKLRDRVLMKDPNFRWCSQCSSGFISEPNLKRLICPDCNAVTCASCRRLWVKEHQGISCEAFAALKDASDPEAQAAGLAKMLTEDGIDCPSCHFRYALAKGGCMHFRCIQCQHDFCSGCSRPFKMGQKCGVSEFCGKLGLHAHHPRNCLFYLRDKEPEDLQKLLDMNDVKYNREPPEGMELRRTCQVMEQKETADGMVDDYCGKEVQDGYAGLCRVHYVEYLGQLVNKHRVDPIQIFDNDDLELVLRRANIRLPPKRYRETDAQYREKLVNVTVQLPPMWRVDERIQDIMRVKEDVI